MTLTDIGKEAAEAVASGGASGGSTSAEQTEYERLDVSDMGFAKVHPGPTAIAGTVVALRYFPPFDDSEFDDNDRGYAGVVLEDPHIPDGAEDGVTIFESTSETGDDYKVVNTDDDGIDTYEVGVSVGNMFEADETDEFSHDQVIVKLDTSAGRSIARTLDVCGRPNADLLRTEDGAPEIQDHGWPEFNNGLIEKCPDNDEDHYEPPQYYRDPQIRPDVEGTEVTILMQHLENIREEYEGNGHWATILADVDDDRQNELAEDYAASEFFEGDEPSDFIDELGDTEVLQLKPTGEFEPDEDLVRATRYTEWRFLEEDEVEQLRDEQGVTV